MALEKVISIVGPTAAGKSALALNLAKQLDAEIVSLDAYQIYRHMDIGTAKASMSEQAEIPHHLIDVVDIDFPATIQDFSDWASAAIADIHARGKIAVCVGGSGLYVQSVLEELDLPPTIPAVRAKLQAEFDLQGIAPLFEKLKQTDPAAAAAIQPGDTRRVIRALEVNEITGKPFKAQLSTNPARYHDLRIGLDVDRVQLRQQIRARVYRMLELGWQQEVEKLVKVGLLETPTASKAIGYAEIDRLNRNQLEFEDAVDLISIATSRFSKRQISWFKRDSKIIWKPLQEWLAADIRSFI